MESVNEVKACGRIIATGKDRRGYSTVTIVIRGIKPAIVRFVVDNLSSSIGVGDNVQIKGYTKAYSYHNEIQDRWISVQYFVAESIEKRPTALMERFGVEGRYHTESRFEAYFQGEVTNTLDTRDPNWGKLTIKVDGTGRDRRPSYITLSYFKSKRLPAFDYLRGDKVCVYASISTPQKEFEGRTVNFENLVIEDIVRIEAVPREEVKAPAQPHGTFLGDLGIDADALMDEIETEE